jgi:hypothetical protein
VRKLGSMIQASLDHRRQTARPISSRSTTAVGEDQFLTSTDDGDADAAPRQFDRMILARADVGAARRLVENNTLVPGRASERHRLRWLPPETADSPRRRAP